MGTCFHLSEVAAISVYYGASLGWYSKEMMKEVKFYSSSFLLENALHKSLCLVRPSTRLHFVSVVRTPFLPKDRLVKCEINIWWISPVFGASWNTTAKFTHFRRDRCSRKLHFLKEQHFSKQSDNALRSETDPVSRATSWPISWVAVYKQDCMIVWMTRHRYKLIRWRED